MAKTRAQRKAEKRKREAQAERTSARDRVEDSRAQQRTQVPESADVVEAELAEAGADLEALKETEPPAPAPSRAEPAPSRADVGAPTDAAAEQPVKQSRRERRAAERERERRARESEARRRPKEQPVERRRGVVTGFIASCWAELRRVQWPNRETLIQASAVTLLFIAVAAAYLGALDLVFSELVELIL